MASQISEIKGTGGAVKPSGRVKRAPRGRIGAIRGQTTVPKVSPPSATQLIDRLRPATPGADNPSSRSPLAAPRHAMTLPRLGAALISQRQPVAASTSSLRFQGLRGGGASSATWMRDSVALAFLAAPDSGRRAVDHALSVGVLTPAQHQLIAEQLRQQADRGGRAQSSLISDHHLVSMLAALPAAVALAIVKERGEAIQKMLEGWAESLREEAKRMAEAQKKASQAAYEQQRVAQSRAVFVRHLQRRTVERDMLTQNVVRRMRVLDEIAPSDGGYGQAMPRFPTRLTANVEILGRTPSARSSRLTGRAMARDRLHGPSLVDESLTYAAFSAYGPPSSAVSMTPPSFVADGPSLRQPQHSLLEIVPKGPFLG